MGRSEFGKGQHRRSKNNFCMMRKLLYLEIDLLVHKLLYIISFGLDSRET